MDESCDLCCRLGCLWSITWTSPPLSFCCWAVSSATSGPGTERWRGWTWSVIAVTRLTRVSASQGNREEHIPSVTKILTMNLQVAFAKTHKTGSSTLQNIFFRYGDRNNLNFAMPEKSWMFSYKEAFNASMVSRLPWARLGFDMFIFHRWIHITRGNDLVLVVSVWNYEEVHKILPDAVFLTLLRNPVQCYESNYVYMGLQNIYK